jgi:NAD(P)-dependent dehydrogenase (short-subunit alcohol dehydrogenase family)
MMHDVARRVAAAQGVAPAQILDRYARANPMGGLISAVDVAQACLFLASPAARSVNGATLDVDGGEAPG